MILCTRRFSISKGGINITETSASGLEYFTPWSAVKEVTLSRPSCRKPIVIVARERWQDPPDIEIDFATVEDARECYAAILSAMEGEQ
jgi:hypothetical protein